MATSLALVLALPTRWTVAPFSAPPEPLTVPVTCPDPVPKNNLALAVSAGPTVTSWFTDVYLEEFAVTGYVFGRRLPMVYAPVLLATAVSAVEVTVAPDRALQRELSFTTPELLPFTVP